jgi:hypothetical protein
VPSDISWIALIRATSAASSVARLDGGRFRKAWKPDSETQSTWHIVEILWLA